MSWSRGGRCVGRRHGLPPPAACDRATGEPIRRYQGDRPGELIHVDVAKLGRIPDDHSRLACTETLPDEKAVTCAAPTPGSPNTTSASAATPPNQPDQKHT
ncbi:hypothetical protein GCM10022380_38400 [Amycolatopsis tucumanensis]|uniref:Transposase n=1 Tax=Amycolatopsis tucumanensis TaxID=401106 RepID=A0ABP7IE97_9PSEU